MTDALTTWAVVIFRVKWRVFVRWWCLCLWSCFGLFRCTSIDCHSEKQTDRKNHSNCWEIRIPFAEVQWFATSCFPFTVWHCETYAARPNYKWTHTCHFISEWKFFILSAYSSSSNILYHLSESICYSWVDSLFLYPCIHSRKSTVEAVSLCDLS